MPHRGRHEDARRYDRPPPGGPPRPDRVRDLRPRSPETAGHVALLATDPQFARDIPCRDRALAERVLVLPRLALAAGPWSAPPRDAWPAPTVGLLLTAGIAARHVMLGERVATQLLGPGDVLDPWGPTWELLPSGVSWSMQEPVTAVVLDGRFATAARRWPSLATVVQERLLALSDRLATHLAICQLPRVEQRILALLWHLAERFGRVGPDGIVLSLGLTHRLIGQLVGAQRPTVSLAMGALVDAGHVMRRDDGALLLTERSHAALTSRTGVAPAVPPAHEPDEPSGRLHDLQAGLDERRPLSARAGRAAARRAHAAALRDDAARDEAAAAHRIFEAS
jgi:hypothetical protein